MFNNAIILLIDDDTWMQRVLSKIINRLEINNIYTASNGFEGVNLAIEKKPNAIFLDLIMPDIDGLTTLKMLKAIQYTNDIPIIIITSNSDFESVGSVLAAGASEFVAKPFSFATIQEKLIKVLSNAVKKSNNAEQNNNRNAFDNLELEHDDMDFFNSFTLERDTDDLDNSETASRTNYKSMANTYKEPPETEINKLINK
jgi:YesN/AraC family two-component response regulator